MANATTTSPLLVHGRIPITTFRVVTLVTFSFALFAVTCRLFALFPQRKRLGLDDVFLIFATICLIVGTTLNLVQVETLYFVEDVELNGLSESPNAVSWADKTDYFQKLRWSFLAVTWSSIFFVKFSFLAFFSGLCERMPRMNLYRKSLYGLCIISLIYLVLNSIVTCPHLGTSSLQCTTPGALQRLMDMGVVAISMDILTDLTILSIPIILLWRVKLKPYQKLVIGFALCLSVVMILLAITRMIGFRYRGVIDNSWIYMWQQVEAGAAVTMISLTAFRSVFTSNISKRSPWKASMPKFVRNAGVASSSSQDLRFNSVSISDTTMAEMPTFICRGNKEDDMDFAGHSGIAVTVDYSVHHEDAVRYPEQALS